MSLLENMRIFVRVVDLGSLSAAGRQVRMSPAVVSHRMQQLEQHLGVRLLNRTTRQVQPTEHGQIFYRHCLEVVEAVERAETSVATASGVPSGSLRVTAPLGFGRRVLAPLVPKFHELHPRVDLRLRLSDHLLDLLGEAVDVAIRMAVLRDSSFVVRKIADCRRVLCAAPAYLEARGTPQKPEDLLDHNCLLLRFPGSQQYQWTLNTPDGPVKLPVSGIFDADDGDVLTQWALDGQGIVLKPVWEIAEHLRGGALKVVLREFEPEPVVLAVLYPHRSFLPAKVRAFSDFLVEHTRPIVNVQDVP
ncbi:LysR family transcriptional regulator [Chelatococcus sp. SYSU_G07232]|uniref:LysR family transcriptional regulator n=1 Tax=Chelatococcus albus TaxID=3047466 RepID=A0ABT7ACG5_9HYPH|nr:LysR family transcriptional regulator [Chelatococcus sp. SYSU_G07232]MDJ1157062.1 LysR family transcriptional regulator [Chelatococcus sp. SYSU_G07232]